MAAANVTRVQELLGKTLLITERIAGFDFERRGIVVGVVTVLPGACVDEEFLLEQDDGDYVYYSPADVTIHSIA